MRSTICAAMLALATTTAGAADEKIMSHGCVPGLQSGSMNLSVERVIAKRRLEEQSPSGGRNSHSSRV
jgi:hypothetical protein